MIQPSCLTFLIDVPKDMGKRDSEENVSTQQHGGETFRGILHHLLFCMIPSYFVHYLHSFIQVLRAYARLYPSLSLRNLSWLTHSLVNGTHRPARLEGKTKNGKESIIKPAGIALTADVALRRAVNVVCSIRSGKKSIGGVTIIVREANVKDKRAAKTLRRKKKEVAEAAEITKIKKRASKVDEAMETIKSGDLVMDCGLLDKYLESISSNKNSMIIFLKKQYYARCRGEKKRTYPGVGIEF